METPPPPPVPQLKNSPLAIWSLVLGIVAVFLCFGPLAGIPAVICGHLALNKIRGSGGMLKGQGMAIAGLVMGYIGVSMIVVGLLAAIAIPNFVVARKTAQKNACINNLRMIDAAKQQWALENGKKEDDVPTMQDIEKYLPNQRLPLECPAGGTYSINKVSEPPTCSEPEHQLKSVY
jgi:competence protein ComGC